MENWDYESDSEFEAMEALDEFALDVPESLEAMDTFYAVQTTFEELCDLRGTEPDVQADIELLTDVLAGAFGATLESIIALESDHDDRLRALINHIKIEQEWRHKFFTELMGSAAEALSIQETDTELKDELEATMKECPTVEEFAEALAGSYAADLSDCVDALVNYY